MTLIDKRIIERSKKAFRRFPFNVKFYNEIKEKGLNSKYVFKEKEKFIKQGRISFKNPNSVESAFRKLISIGILRREVDGQGLTSKVRITPLGRKIIDANPELLNSKNNIFQKLLNILSRYINY